MTRARKLVVKKRSLRRLDAAAIEKARGGTILVVDGSDSGNCYDPGSPDGDTGADRNLSADATIEEWGMSTRFAGGGSFNHNQGLRS